MLVLANIFQPLIDVFEAVLKFFHNTVGIPWGWSIVVLTIVVRAVMVPLTFRQIKSMVRMQALAPEMKALQAKYKDDKQRQQQEIMKFYRENNVNPLGSCLPLVAQLPVFISLYYMLRQSLRADICPKVQPGWDATLGKVTSTAHTVACGGHGASGFLFIHDLTDRATGVTLIVLLVLYVGTQLVSSLVMSAATTDPTQRRIMMFMPLIFVAVVIRFPAGVLVYWITTNTWTIFQQYIVKRRIGPVQAATVTAGGGSDAAAAGNGGASSGGLSGLAALLRGGDSSPPADGGKSGRSGAKATPTRPATGATKAKAKATDSNGSDGGTRGRKAKPEQGEAAPVPSSAARGAPPPRSPRKKKKRSGRRR